MEKVPTSILDEKSKKDKANSGNKTNKLCYLCLTETIFSHLRLI